MPITREDLAKTFWGGLARDMWGAAQLPGKDKPREPERRSAEDKAAWESFLRAVMDGEAL